MVSVFLHGYFPDTMFKKLLPLVLVCLSFVAISKAGIKLHFNNVVNGKELVLDNETYKNAHGDEFTLSMCKYYISNVTFIKTDGTAVNIENSYHLVSEQKPSSFDYVMDALPEGGYVEMKFMIGVDSLHNVSGAQGGELDPINAMFWDWHTGYIMAKIEGRSPAAQDGEIAFHIGGFSGETSALRWITLKFPHAVKVTSGKTPVINLQADIAEWFRTPATVDFSKLSVVTLEGKEAAMIADNYADMFTIKSIDETAK